MFHNLKLPTGERIALDTSKDTDRIKTLREYGLDASEAFCNDNWLNPGHSFVTSPELKIKNYLGACAGYILQGDSPDTLSPYREKAISKKELPISQMPASLRDQVYGSAGVDTDGAHGGTRRAFANAGTDTDGVKKKKPTRKRKWPLTRYQKIHRIKEELGEAEFLYCGIDTENNFLVEGDAFRVDASIEEYKPVETRFGPHYLMDHVIVLIHPETRRILRFCTQNMDVIPDEKITRGDESWASIVVNAAAETSVQPETPTETDGETAVAMETAKPAEAAAVMDGATIHGTPPNSTTCNMEHATPATTPVWRKDGASTGVPSNVAITPHVPSAARVYPLGSNAHGARNPHPQPKQTKHGSQTGNLSVSRQNRGRERDGTIRGCSTECYSPMSSNGFGTPSLARTSASYSATPPAVRVRPP